jgi:recombination associated protein RdgC
VFRNIRLYRLHGDWPDAEQDLSEQLAGAAFKPCGAFTERSAGFEPPSGDADALLGRRVGGADLLRLRVQSRLLPAAAVNEALETRLEDFRNRTGRDPSRKEKRQLKEEVHAELMPKTLVKSQRISGLCLHTENESERLIGIDTASESNAELFLDNLRSALGSLQVTPLAFKQPIGTLLTKIFLGQGPTNFTPGRECRMEDPSAGRATVTWQDIDLDADVRKHVRSGLKLTRLAVEFDDLLSCVIDDQGVVRKLRLQGTEVADELEDENLLARLDADFVMLTGNLRRLMAALRKLLGGYD